MAPYLAVNNDDEEENNEWNIIDEKKNDTDDDDDAVKKCIVLFIYIYILDTRFSIFIRIYFFHVLVVNFRTFNGDPYRRIFFLVK